MASHNSLFVASCSLSGCLLVDGVHSWYRPLLLDPSFSLLTCGFSSVGLTSLKNLYSQNHNKKPCATRRMSHQVTQTMSQLYRRHSGLGIMAAPTAMRPVSLPSASFLHQSLSASITLLSCHQIACMAAIIFLRWCMWPNQMVPWSVFHLARLSNSWRLHHQLHPLDP